MGLLAFPGRDTPRSNLVKLKSLAFGSVLVEFLGIPLPSAPILVYGGATARGAVELVVLILVAAVAATMGDALWFHVARRRGRRLIGLYCKVSLGSGQCVTRTATWMSRLGHRSLVVAKLVPGLATFAAPASGFGGLSWSLFLKWDFAGSVVWASVWVLGGQVVGERVIEGWLDDGARLGPWLLGVFLVSAAAYLGFKLVRRWRFQPADVAEAGSGHVFDPEGRFEDVAQRPD